MKNVMWGMFFVIGASATANSIFEISEGNWIFLLPLLGGLMLGAEAIKFFTQSIPKEQEMKPDDVSEEIHKRILTNMAAGRLMGAALIKKNLEGLSAGEVRDRLMVLRTMAIHVLANEMYNGILKMGVSKEWALNCTSDEIRDELEAMFTDQYATEEMTFKKKNEDATN